MLLKEGKEFFNILKREKSFRMGDHFSKIIKKVSFFFYLNIICALSRMPVIPEKLHQKSTWIQYDFYWTKCSLKSSITLII